MVAVRLRIVGKPLPMIRKRRPTVRNRRPIAGQPLRMIRRRLPATGSSWRVTG
ncbi:MAG TPA: hypothetical protein VH394_11120 [Thermoanaerobaculia bacterium]|nr:hypothetical protein [Thermoanaerobaculia bacterium]